jgi:signal transduction histidine kinase
VNGEGGLDLPLRLRRAARGLAYMLVSVPLGVLSAAGVLLAAVGAALSVVWIGVPIFHAAVAVCRWTADRDRRAANALLGAHIPPLILRRDDEPDAAPARPWLDVLADRQLTRMLTLCAIKLPVALAMLAVAAVAVGATLGLVLLGLKGIAGIGAPVFLGPVKTNAGGGLLMCLFAVPVGVLAVAALGSGGTILRTLARSLLLAPQRAGNEPVREMLAESLGDRTLSIAYWLPDREIFVDETGREVALPEPGSGRAWTAVDRDGQRVAAILHAAELDAGHELVDAAAAAAALALDNERLKADLRARVEDLRVSRVRIVEAADAARRRIERDLHDGAQQHLVSLALDLRMLKAQLREAELKGQVDELIEKLAVALDELRELARGIHPVVLTAQGLGPAVRALADRSPIPVAADVDVGEERLPPAIEAAAYFVVGEALTNVGKYAEAERAEVTIRRTAGEVVVVVRDDGVGGADLRAGSGLRGLDDRLAALDGTLRVESPRGAGTRVEARIPFRADSGAAPRAAAPVGAEAPR